MSGNPATTAHDFQFRLCTTEASDSTIAPPTGGLLGTLTRTGVQASNGVVTVNLDFGTSFTGADRWLDISVRPAGLGLSRRSPGDARYKLAIRNTDVACDDRRRPLTVL